jgi:hypothetical protein
MADSNLAAAMTALAVVVVVSEVVVYSSCYDCY